MNDLIVLSAPFDSIDHLIVFECCGSRSALEVILDEERTEFANTPLINQLINEV